jgi:hypothetical protein
LSHHHSRRNGAPTSSTEKFEHKVTPGQMAKFNAFMQTADQKSKNFVTEVAAEQFAEITAERRGLKVTVTPADKGARGGPDMDARNGNGHQSRIEAKGGSSRLSKGQRNPNKTLQTDPNKMIDRKGQFSKASRLDRAAADTSQKTLQDGGTLSYEVNRTKATPNGFQTTVKTRTYAAAETGTQGGEVTTTRDPSVITGDFKELPRATIPLRNAAARPTPPASGQATSSKSPAPGGGPGSITRSGGAPSGKF